VENRLMQNVLGGRAALSKPEIAVLGFIKVHGPISIGDLSARLL
jgi:hypothetical protein